VRPVSSTQPIQSVQQPKKESQQVINKPIETIQPVQSQKEPNINIQLDPNDPDLKNAKVNINMDAETAYKLYQSNKQYLPSTQQMINGATKTAEVVGSMSNKDEVVTGNKAQSTSKKGLFDPLTSLFGVKKDTSSSQQSQTNKKGQF
jgi:hypothetical protein